MMLLVLVVFFAQQPPITAALAPNQPFRIAFQADPQDRFRWWCDGQILKNFKPSELTVGERQPTTILDGFVPIEADVPGLPAGTHSCQVSATNAFMEEFGWPDKKSEAIPIYVGSEAKTPIELRIVIKIGGV